MLIPDIISDPSPLYVAETRPTQENRMINEQLNLPLSTAPETTEPTIYVVPVDPYPVMTDVDDDEFEPGDVDSEGNAY